MDIYTDLKILLVDDQPDILEVIETKIELDFPGAVVVTAENGFEALQKLEDFNPTLIITDLKMPRMNGLKFTKEVLKTNPKVPIILHSGYMDVLDLIENIEIGFQGFVEKPANLDMFVEEIVRILNKIDLAHDDYIIYDIDRLMKKEVYPFDLYIRLGKIKFLHVFRKGENVSHDKLGNLKNKKVGNFYIKSNDYLEIDEDLYIPIKVLMLVPEVVVDFNLYKKNNDNRFENIFKQGTQLTVSHLKILKKHNIKQLFVSEEDELKYQAYTERTINRFIKLGEVSIKDKAESVSQYSTKFIKEIYDDPKNANYDKVVKVGSVISNYLGVKNKFALNSILDLQTNNSLLVGGRFNKLAIVFLY